MTETEFKAKLTKKIRERIPGCIITKNDPSFIQGIPDLLILFGKYWATLECKKSEDAPCRPNQEHYVELMDRMSFSRFAYPENQEEVLDELEQFFKRQSSKVPKRQS